MDTGANQYQTATAADNHLSIQSGDMGCNSQHSTLPPPPPCNLSSAACGSLNAKITCWSRQHRSSQRVKATTTVETWPLFPEGSEVAAACASKGQFSFHSLGYTRKLRRVACFPRDKRRRDNGFHPASHRGLGTHE